MKYSLIVSIFLLITISGCGTVQQPKQSEAVSSKTNSEVSSHHVDIEDGARIHFYREQSSRGMFANPRFHVDGEKAIKLPNGSVSTLTVAPGSRTIEYRKNWWSNSYAKGDLKFDLDVESNQDYYIKYVFGTVEYEYTGFPYYPLSAKINQYLIVIPEDIAKEEISNLRNVPPLVQR